MNGTQAPTTTLATHKAEPSSDTNDDVTTNTTQGLTSTASTRVQRSTTGPIWPDLAPEHPLRRFQGRLASILEEARYDEVFGVKLSIDATHPLPPIAAPVNSTIRTSAGNTVAAEATTATAAAGGASDAVAPSSGPIVPFTTTLILQKFLRANANDVEKAVEQLKGTLKWRKEFQPLKAAQEENFDEGRFGGLGYITVINRREDAGAGENAGGRGRSGGKIGKEVVTWNIYGAVKDAKRTFGDLDAFIRWRVALMERAITHLDLSNAKDPIPDYNQGPDPYRMIQVHDYLNVRFLRMDPTIRAASQRTIHLFQQHYPEMLSRKFFVNVPLLMGWLFAAMKLVVARDTSRKLTMLSYGEQLVLELGRDIPSTYGGTGKTLEEVGEKVKLGKGVEPVESVGGGDAGTGGGDDGVN